MSLYFTLFISFYLSPSLRICLTRVFILFHFLLNKNTSISSHCVALTNFKAPVRRLEATCNQQRMQFRNVRMTFQAISSQRWPPTPSPTISITGQRTSTNPTYPMSPIIDDYYSILATNIDLSLILPISQLVVEHFLCNPLHPWFDLWLHSIDTRVYWLRTQTKWFQHSGGDSCPVDQTIPFFVFFWTGYSRAVPASILCDRGRLFYCKPFTSLIASL